MLIGVCLCVGVQCGRRSDGRVDWHVDGLQLHWGWSCRWHVGNCAADARPASHTHSDAGNSHRFIARLTFTDNTSDINLYCTRLKPRLVPTALTSCAYGARSVSVVGRQFRIPGRSSPLAPYRWSTSAASARTRAALANPSLHDHL